MKFQIVSSLHIERYGENVDPDPRQFITPLADVLFIAGNCGKIEFFRQYSRFMKKLCSMFQKVVMCPGVQEYISDKYEYTMTTINERLQELQNENENLIILKNGELGKLEDNIFIFGGCFFHATRKQNKLPLIFKEKEKLLDFIDYNFLHFDFLQKLRENMEFIDTQRENYSFILLTFFETVGEIDSQNLTCWISGTREKDEDNRYGNHRNENKKIYKLYNVGHEFDHC